MHLTDGTKPGNSTNPEEASQDINGDKSNASSARSSQAGPGPVNIINPDPTQPPIASATQPTYNDDPEVHRRKSSIAIQTEPVNITNINSDPDQPLPTSDALPPEMPITNASESPETTLTGFGPQGVPQNAPTPTGFDPTTNTPTPRLGSQGAPIQNAPTPTGFDHTTDTPTPRLGSQGAPIQNAPTPTGFDPTTDTPTPRLGSQGAPIQNAPTPTGFDPTTNTPTPRLGSQGAPIQNDPPPNLPPGFDPQEGQFQNVPPPNFPPGFDPQGGPIQNAPPPNIPPGFDPDAPSQSAPPPNFSPGFDPQGPSQNAPPPNLPPDSGPPGQSPQTGFPPGFDPQGGPPQTGFPPGYDPQGGPPQTGFPTGYGQQNQSAQTAPPPALLPPPTPATASGYGEPLQSAPPPFLSPPPTPSYSQPSMAPTPSQSRTNTVKSKKSNKSSGQKISRVIGCLKSCCSCIWRFICMGYSGLLWLLLLIGILMATHLIYWKGCGLDILKFVDIEENYKTEPMIGFLATLGYFLYFFLMTLCYICCKTCCLPNSPKKMCTCKEVKLFFHLVYGTALSYYLLTMTKLPETGGGKRRGDHDTRVHWRDGRRKRETELETSSVEPDTSSDSPSGTNGSKNIETPHHIKSRPNTPSLQNMDCIGYCHFYGILLILLGVLAFVIFSMERRKLRNEIRPSDSTPSVAASQRSKATSRKSKAKQAKSNLSNATNKSTKSHMTMCEI